MVGINWKHYSALAVETMACYAGLTSLLVIQQIFIERQLCDVHKPRFLECIRVRKRQRFQPCVFRCTVFCILVKSVPTYCPSIPLHKALWELPLSCHRPRRLVSAITEVAIPPRLSEVGVAYQPSFFWGAVWKRGKDAGKGLPQSPPPSKECTASSFPSYFSWSPLQKPHPLTNLPFSIWFLPSPCLQLWFDSFFLDFGTLCSLSLEFNFD